MYMVVLMNKINLLNQRFLTEIFDRKREDIRFFQQVGLYVLSSTVGCLAGYILIVGTYGRIKP